MSLESVSKEELVERANKIVMVEIDRLLRQAGPLIRQIAVLRLEAQAIYDELKRREDSDVRQRPAQGEALPPGDKSR